MKKLLIILTILFGLLLSSCNLQADTITETEVVTNTKPTSSVKKATPTPMYLSELYELKMFLAGEGWATNIDKSRIFSTSNFGAHFFDVTPAEFSNLPAGGGTYTHFANSRAAWVCRNQAGENGKLFRTSDSGKSWTAIDLGFPCGMMDFASLELGYILASEDVGMGSQYMSLHKTEDGGSTWAEVFRHQPEDPQNPGLPSSGVKNQFVVLDENTMFVGGSEPVPGSLYLYQSSDGGSSWNRKDCQGLPDSDDAELTPTNIIRVSNTEAFVTVQAFLPNQVPMPTHFCHTTDAGETWDYLSSLQGVAFADFGSSEVGVAYADDKMYQSTDGGKTWVDVSVGLPIAITPVAVDMVSDIFGYMTCTITPDTLTQNRIYMTVEGGKLWKSMPGNIVDKSE